MSRESIAMRAEEASRGPWHRLPPPGTTPDSHMGAVMRDEDGTVVAYTASWSFGQRHADALFIAHARTDVVALLALADAVAALRDCPDAFAVVGLRDRMYAALAELEALP